MAFSLFGLALAAGSAAAQQPQTTSYPMYNAIVSPWPAPPSSPRIGGWSNSPAAVPAQFGTPAPAPTAAPVPSPYLSRTVYYKKESGSSVVPASNQPLKTEPATPEYQIELRGLNFRLESEKTLNERINLLPDPERPEKKPITRAQMEEDFKKMKAGRKDLSGTYFPAYDTIPTAPYKGHSYAQMAIQAEPHYVCFGRLFFEEKNTERYGWDAGPVTPLLLTANFCNDCLSLPYKVCSFPRLRYDSSAGQCLPGDPVPALAYPVPLSVTGGLAQAGVTVALYFIIP
jgi:hypothetical protein